MKLRLCLTVLGFNKENLFIILGNEEENTQATHKSHTNGMSTIQKLANIRLAVLEDNRRTSHYNFIRT